MVAMSLKGQAVMAAPQLGWKPLAKSPAEQLPFQWLFSGWWSTSARGPAPPPPPLSPHSAALRSNVKVKNGVK